MHSRSSFSRYSVQRLLLFTKHRDRNGKAISGEWSQPLESSDWRGGLGRRSKACIAYNGCSELEHPSLPGAEGGPSQGGLPAGLVMGKRERLEVLVCRSKGGW